MTCASQTKLSHCLFCNCAGSSSLRLNGCVFWCCIKCVDVVLVLKSLQKQQIEGSVMIIAVCLKESFLWKRLECFESISLTFKLSRVLDASIPKFCIILKIWSLGSEAAVPHMPFGIELNAGMSSSSIGSAIIQRCRLIWSIEMRLQGCKTNIFRIRFSQSSGTESLNNIRKWKPVAAFALLSLYLSS